MKLDVSNNNVTLGSLKNGETFKYGEHYYMRTSNGFADGYNAATCVGLNDGRIYSLDLSYNVIKIPLKVVLDN